MAIRFAIAVCSILLAEAGLRADEPSPIPPEQLEFFEQKVRPLLVAKCYECHAGEKIKGGLSLASRRGWEIGGDRGPAIVPGKPAESLTVLAIRYTDPDLQMPPAGRLTEAEIEILETWVRLGAPDPRDETTTKPVAPVDPAAGRDHWAYRPLNETSPPAVRDASWALDDIDRFVLAKLEDASLTPSPDADRYAWLRRASLDLTGLPPTPAEISAFVADASDRAFETVVDRLLRSRAFGERWARPWLDLAGYADQIGSANNVPAEHAWRYRDYVIRALETDKPYDVFVREQVAGDLLGATSIEERQDQITATGFLVLGNVNIVEADKLVMEMDLVDQQIEKLGKAFLAQTLNCVRCHDHKFDPIKLPDYYGLAGIFASTRSTYKIDRGVWSSVAKATLPETIEQFAARESAARGHRKQTAAIEAERTAVLARLKELESLVHAAKANPQPTAEQTASLAALEKERGELAGKPGELQRKLWHLDYLKPTPPIVYCVEDLFTATDARVQVRGNPHVLGDVVPRGFVEVVSHGPAPAIPPDASGRLQLGEWLTGPASPLLARVRVNRIWHKLFGRGIVGSVDYFGTRGEAPSHPELLDRLARDFIADGWSQKRLIRRLVLSRVYRQTALIGESSRAALAADPDNRLLGRMVPRRLEAEMLRDAALAASGRLRAIGGGPALSPEFLENVGGLDPSDVNPISFSLTKFRDEQAFLRTVYLPVVRSSEQRGPADILNFFDFPQPAQYTSDRPTTAVASQALFLLNGPLLKEAADKLATDVAADGSLAHDADRVAWLYMRVLNRPPTTDEVSEAAAFVSGAGASDSAGVPTSGWKLLAQALLASNEFLFRL